MDVHVSAGEGGFPNEFTLPDADTVRVDVSRGSSRLGRRDIPSCSTPRHAQGEWSTRTH